MIRRLILASVACGALVAGNTHAMNSGNSGDGGSWDGWPPRANPSSGSPHPLLPMNGDGRVVSPAGALVVPAAAEAAGPIVNADVFPEFFWNQEDDETANADSPLIEGVEVAPYGGGGGEIFWHPENNPEVTEAVGGDQEYFGGDIVYDEKDDGCETGKCSTADGKPQTRISQEAESAEDDLTLEEAEEILQGFLGDNGTYYLGVQMGAMAKLRSSRPPLLRYDQMTEDQQNTWKTLRKLGFVVEEDVMNTVRKSVTRPNAAAAAAQNADQGQKVSGEQEAESAETPLKSLLRIKSTVKALLMVAPAGHPYIQPLKMLKQQLDGHIKHIDLNTMPDAPRITNLVRQMSRVLRPIEADLRTIMDAKAKSVSWADEGDGGGGGGKS